MLPLRRSAHLASSLRLRRTDSLRLQRAAYLATSLRLRRNGSMRLRRTAQLARGSVWRFATAPMVNCHHWPVGIPVWGIRTVHVQIHMSCKCSLHMLLCCSRCNTWQIQFARKLVGDLPTLLICNCRHRSQGTCMQLSPLELDVVRCWPQM